LIAYYRQYCVLQQLLGNDTIFLTITTLDRLVKLAFYTARDTVRMALKRTAPKRTGAESISDQLLHGLCVLM